MDNKSQRTEHGHFFLQEHGGTLSRRAFFLQFLAAGLKPKLGYTRTNREQGETRGKDMAMALEFWALLRKDL